MSEGVDRGEIEVGIRIDRHDGIAFFGTEGVNDGLQRGGRMVAVECFALGILLVDPARPAKEKPMSERITVNPLIHFGKPCVAGTRIPVQSVLELVREGLSFSEIIRDYYPDLQPEDIRACVQYAIDVVAAEDIHLAATP
jgi:uncharacterized protein (DUF433 family)